MVHVFGANLASLIVNDNTRTAEVPLAVRARCGYREDAFGEYRKSWE